jgi:hypothetical protein
VSGRCCEISERRVVKLGGDISRSLVFANIFLCNKFFWFMNGNFGRE